MSTFAAQCPYCPAKIHAPVSLAGRKIACPQCGQTIRLGHPAASVQAPFAPTVPAPGSVAQSPAPQTAPPQVIVYQGTGEGTAPSAGNGLANAGGTLGIIGIALCVTVPCFGSFFGLILGILGIIFSGIGLARASRAKQGKGMAITGLVLSILCVLWVPIWVFVFVGGIASMIGGAVGKDTKPQITSNPSGSQAQVQPALGTLQLRFVTAQRFDDMELFIDGKKRSDWNAYQNRLSLTPGRHTVAIRIRSKQEFSKAVEVATADGGITPLEIPLLLPSGIDGTLRLEIKCPDYYWTRNSELFIDAVKLMIPSFSLDGRIDRQLSPGEHTLVVKTNGVEVARKKVEIRPPSEGDTIVTWPIRTTGSVVLEVRAAPLQGEVVRVYLDGTNVKQWPVGALSVHLTVEVGKREFRLVMEEPRKLEMFKFSVDIEPNAEVVKELR